MKKTLAIVLLFASTSAFSDNVRALQDADLMKVFWKCHTISDETEKSGKSSFPESLMAICTRTSKEVQQRYFNDDFGVMHAWTTKNYSDKPTKVTQ